MDRFVDVTGGRLFATSEGEGPPIVLLHAFIADHRAWDAMVPGLVAEGFRVVRYDCRTFGASTTEDVDYSERADLIAVLDAFEIGRAALVGNSGGGRVAFDTAIESPGRVVAVVGVGASLSGFEGKPNPAEQPLIEQAEKVMSAPEHDLDAIADVCVRLWVDGPGQPADRVDPAIRESVRAMCRPLSDRGRVRGKPIAMEPAANDRLAELVCPALAVAGTLDLSELTQVAKRIEAAAPDALAVVWPHVAHMIGMELPERLNALIVEFLAPLRPWE
jgi:3-oxoadipate enol-lactonase